MQGETANHQGPEQENEDTMRPLKVIAAALALSLLAAPAMAETRPAKPPAAAKAARGKAAKGGKGEKGEKGAKGDKDKAGAREARIVEVLKKNGVEDARAKRVVAVMKKYRTERQPVQAELKKQREALHALTQSNSTDETAYTAAIDGIEAQRKKLADIQQRQITEVRGILKPSEQAKVMHLMNRAKHGRGGGKHRGGEKSNANS